jgi:peroxiredoxin Q/BCP
MRRFAALALLAGALATGSAAPAAAQETGSKLISVGEMAPDFALPGATRYGVLQNPVKLSDFRGETVVLAFFFKVRTPG